MNDAKCNSCGAAIKWAKSAKSGKAIPLDAQQCAGNIDLDGFGIARVVGKGKGHYNSHFATCLHPKLHRKEGKKK